MQATIDLDAYFRRIGYQGPREPTLAVLSELQQRHMQRIAFENLDSLLRRPVRLDLPSIEAKLVHGARGGYCFEQNMLFRQVLLGMGLPVVALAGRVFLDEPPDAQPARTHMMLVSEIEGRSYLVDVGFGGQSPTGPLLFEPGLEQTTPHEPYRLVEVDEDYALEAFVDGTWTQLYRFDRTPQLDINYEVANHYVATYPTSFFCNALVAARPEPGGRHTLVNDRLSFRPTGGAKSTRRLAGADEVVDVLARIFGLDVPDQPGFEAAFARLDAGSVSN